MGVKDAGLQNPASSLNGHIAIDDVHLFLNSKLQ